MALFQSEAVTPHTLAREREGLMRELRFNRTRFIDFLGTMARHYRQPLDRQISIFFHAPQSGTAYADVPLWWRLGRCLIPHPGERNRGVPVLGADGEMDVLYDIAQTMPINGTLCTDPVKAGELLGEAAKSYSTMKDFAGEYKGMRLSLLLDRETMQPLLTVHGKTPHRIVLSDKPSITMKRFAMMGQAAVDRIKEVQKERDKLAANIADAKEKARLPFPYAEEEAKKKARLIEINHAMAESMPERREEKVAREPAKIPVRQPVLAR